MNELVHAITISYLQQGRIGEVITISRKNEECVHFIEILKRPAGRRRE